MSLYQDRQIKGFLLFLTLFALLFVGTATVLTIYQVNDAEVLWLKHDEAVILTFGTGCSERSGCSCLYEHRHQ